MDLKKQVSAVIFMFLVLCLVAGCGPTRVEKAEKLWKAGSNSEAVDLLREEIKDRPENGEAFFLLGKVLFETERESAKEKFLSAIKVNEDMKEQVLGFVLKHIDSRSDLDFLNKVENGYVDGVANLCYRYYVEMAPGNLNASTFAAKFPRDPRAPKSILLEAEYLKQESADYPSKELYKRLAKDYPNSSEGKEAKKILSDWWFKRVERLQADNRWHGYAIKKGQPYRYNISGQVVLQDGFGAIHRYDGGDTAMFIGTREDLKEFKSHCSFGMGFTGTGPRAVTAENSNSGVAPRGGMIWFKIQTEGEFNGGLDVTLELKDKT